MVEAGLGRSEAAGRSRGRTGAAGSSATQKEMDPALWAQAASRQVLGEPDRNKQPARPKPAGGRNDGSGAGCGNPRGSRYAVGA